MRIKRVRVRNYRALRDSEIDLASSTCIIGENNAGKSAFLQAIDLFFGSSTSVKSDDFHQDDTTRPIEITIEFDHLTESETDKFSANMFGDRLIVTRKFSADKLDSGKFYTTVSGYAGFSKVREETKKSEKRALYNNIKENLGLPTVSNADQIEPNLIEWETNNPDKLELIQIAGFRGFTNVALGDLNHNTAYIFVRALKSIEEVADDKRSPVKELVNTIARQTIQNNKEFQSFLSEANDKVKDYTDPDKVKELSGISDGLTSILEKYYRGSEIIATWNPINELSVSYPVSNILVKDSGYMADIQNSGHGLQRAVILSVLEYLAIRNASGDADTEFQNAQSDIIIAIEEPEIFQHPTKQRLFSKLLRELSDGFSRETGIRFQVIFVTHSPLFVDLHRCDEIRVVRRMNSEKHQFDVGVTQTTLAECSKTMAVYSGQSAEDAFEASVFAEKLHIFTPEIAEGFFGKCVVLVEGVSDKAVLEGWYRRLARSPLAEGIVIVSVDGKSKIDRPSVIFQKLNIPIFIVMDNDKSYTKKKEKTRIKENKILQRCACIEENKIEEWPSGVYSNLAAFDGNIERYIQSVVGDDLYSQAKQQASEMFRVDGSDCMKSPAVASSILTKFIDDGQEFDFFDSIVGKVDELVGS